MKEIEDYFNEKLADVLEQDQERWDTKYMPSIHREHYLDVDIDEFIGDEEWG